ncbi:MAG: hypothetical protein HY518_03340 [Candidatus Aenigmarchaeota archaeon]|nr:hypothetical protein [Candidatus Aenigmarchaeota archaeon]
MAGSEYERLGVDVQKKGIEAFKDARTGLYQHAFCTIHPYPGRPGYGFVHHADGAGSKSVQNYLNWKETGDFKAFEGIAQDTLAMNIGDVFCVGRPEFLSFIDYVAINRLPVPKAEVLQILAREYAGLFEMLRGFGIDVVFAGGETADLPDQVRTLDSVGAVFADYKLADIITGEDIRAGDAIIGISSGGQAKYEKRPAGAIMSNGLTLARHCLMREEHGEKYPEILQRGKRYTGSFCVTDRVEGIEGTIGEEITRPTRLFAPIFKGLVEEFGTAVHGIVYNTGGGHTKCLRVGKGILYVKDSLPDPPMIFRLVQQHGNVSWEEMHEDFNMGVGADLQVDPGAAGEVMDYVWEEFGVASSRIGSCESSEDGANRARLITRYGTFDYPR